MHVLMNGDLQHICVRVLSSGILGGSQEHQILVGCANGRVVIEPGQQKAQVRVLEPVHILVYSNPALLMRVQTKKNG